MSPPNIRIAHVTDLHLRDRQPGSAPNHRRRSRETKELLASALERARKDDCDLVAVTGDLLDVPIYVITGETTYDYRPEEWRAWARADYHLIRRMLDACGLPWMVLPGNHDWEPVFREVFPEPVETQRICDIPVLSFWDREYEGHFPRRLDRERVRFMESLTSSVPPQHQVHLQHYVIEPELNEGYPHSYAECAELAGKIAAAPGEVLCISGHYHRGTPVSRLGSGLFAVTPALCECPHRFRIYDWTSDGLAVEEITVADQPRTVGKPAIFLDRDGTINTLPSYRTGPDRMELIPGAAGALRSLAEAGYALVVVTSQSAIGLGYVRPVTVDAVNDRMCALLLDAGVAVDAIYYSAGAGEDAVMEDYRTPVHEKPRHIADAANLLQLQLDGSWMIGDSPNDLEAAAASGLGAILVRTGNGRTTEKRLPSGPAPVVADDLAAAAAYLFAKPSANPRITEFRVSPGHAV